MAAAPAPTTGQDTSDDPVALHDELLADLAVAQKKAELLAADVAVVSEKFDMLAGAQSRYREARTASAVSFRALKEQVPRIKAAIECKLPDDKQDKLDGCWEKVKPAEAAGRCTAVDEASCDSLPQDLGALRTLQDQAKVCIAETNDDFDALAALPGGLGDRIDALTKVATDLEQEIGGAANDPVRSYAEYKKLQWDFDRLDAVWFDPAEYSTEIKKAFVTLLHRHGIGVCIAVTVFAEERKQQPTTTTDGPEVQDVVDLVLECYARPTEQQAPQQS